MITTASHIRSRRRLGRTAVTGGAYLASLLLAFAILLVLGTVVLTRVPVLGHRAVIINGGSMEPTVVTGALVFARQTGPDSLQERDIITFRYPESKVTVTHRIIGSRVEGGTRWFTVKGDANSAADPEQISFETGQAYRMLFSVPYAGYLFAYLGSIYGTLALVVLPAAILMALQFAPRRRPHGAEATDDIETPPDAGALFGVAQVPELTPTEENEVDALLNRPVSARIFDPDEARGDIEAFGGSLVEGGTQPTGAEEPAETVERPSVRALILHSPKVRRRKKVSRQGQGALLLVALPLLAVGVSYLLSGSGDGRSANRPAARR